MPKGITQEQVNAAADALVAAGDKPTVDKVRQALGTGSPNTVTRMLENWRATLAQRMQKVITLPDLPSEVGQAFTELWRLAVAHATTQAQAALATEQNALFAEQTNLEQERKLWQIALDEARGQATEATMKLAYAEVQGRERASLIAQLEAQVTDVRQQRERLQADLELQRAALATLQSEHTSLQNHLRTHEDRAHREVDQARQDIKGLQQRLEKEQREHLKVVAELKAQHDVLRAAAHSAEQMASHQVGRVTALEATLAQWQTTLKTAKPSTRKASPAKAQTRGMAPSKKRQRT